MASPPPYDPPEPSSPAVVTLQSHTIFKLEEADEFEEAFPTTPRADPDESHPRTTTPRKALIAPVIRTTSSQSRPPAPDHDIGPMTTAAVTADVVEPSPLPLPLPLPLPSLVLPLDLTPTHDPDSNSAAPHVRPLRLSPRNLKPLTLPLPTSTKQWQFSKLKEQAGVTMDPEQLVSPAIASASPDPSSSASSLSGSEQRAASMASTYSYLSDLADNDRDAYIDRGQLQGKRPATPHTPLAPAPPSPRARDRTHIYVHAHDHDHSRQLQANSNARDRPHVHMHMHGHSSSLSNVSDSYLEDRYHVPAQHVHVAATTLGTYSQNATSSSATNGVSVHFDEKAVMIEATDWSNQVSLLFF